MAKLAVVVELLVLVEIPFDPGVRKTAGKRRRGLLPSLLELGCAFVALPPRPFLSPELSGLLPLGLVLLLFTLVDVVTGVEVAVDAVVCALVPGVGAAKLVIATEDTFTLVVRCN